MKMDSLTAKDRVPTETGWRRERANPSLREVHRSMPVPKKGSTFRKFLAFVGPGYLVAVGYMDPGNWLQISLVDRLLCILCFR